MKLSDILEHDIVSKSKQKPKIFWKIPRMKRIYPPFSKGAFKTLINPTGGEQLKNPVGGKVVQDTNTMDQKEIRS